MAQRVKKGWPLHMIQKYAAARRELFYKRLMLERLGFVRQDDKSWLHPNGARFPAKLFEMFDFDKTAAKLKQMGFIPNTHNSNRPIESADDTEDF